MTGAARTLAVALLLPLVPLPLAGQGAEEGENGWDMETEVGGAFFFGNTSQTTFTTRIGAETADSVREFGVEGGFSYGEAENDEGEQFVSQRSWKVESALDYRPFERWSPFISGTAESSFEQRIELRYNFGVGARYQLLRSERTEVAFRAALLGEETNPRNGAADADFNDDLRARWSIRGNARRNWDDGRLTLETESVWRTYFERWEDFTFSLKSSLGFRLNDRISLKVTFVDNYDSEAKARGADTNNDGQVFLTLLSSF